MNYLLVWDIDGTLIKITGVGIKAMERAFCELYNVENAFSGVDMAGYLDAIILKNAFSHHRLCRDNINELCEKYTEILALELKKSEVPLACPGIVKLLETISRKKNMYNIIGTGNMEKSARIKLSAANLDRFFPIGGFSDGEEERWQLIERAISNARLYFGIDFNNENIFIIGDTPRDIECGIKLQVKTIGVATGSYTSERLKQHGADYVFESLENIEAFLEVFT
ncbi:MAG: HAD family hydrolase [Acetivibrionales bacterium]